MITYLCLLILLVISAWLNKELIDDMQISNLIESGQWHKVQLVYWCAIFCMPSLIMLDSDTPPMFIGRYMIRVIFFGLMYSGVYNLFLNWFRDEKWNHTGINDFACEEVLLIFASIGFILAVAFEIFIRIY